MKLDNPSELKKVIEKFGFSFSKSLGQNFLIDHGVLESIVEGSGVDKNSCALEIGPGAGVLTRELAAAAKSVVAIEIDKNLMPLLDYTLGEFDNVTVINEDVLKVDLGALIKENFKGAPVHLVANLPYYITTPIVMKFLEEGVGVRSLTVMVQKEVADRMVAKPGGKDYGALSLAVQYYTVPKVIVRAEPHCFMPQPKVASVVVHLEVQEEPTAKVNNKKLMFDIIKSAFGQRRKTLVNALSKSPYINISKESVFSALLKMGLSADIRGEKLSLSDFARLSDCLEEEIKNDK